MIVKEYHSLKSQENISSNPSLQDQIQRLLANNKNIPLPLVFNTISRLLINVHLKIERNANYHALMKTCCKMLVTHWQQHRHEECYQNQTLFHMLPICIRVAFGAKKGFYAIENSNFHYLFKKGLMPEEPMPECFLDSCRIFENHPPRDLKSIQILSEIKLEGSLLQYPRVKRYISEYLSLRSSLLPLIKQTEITLNTLEKLKDLAKLMVEKQCSGDIFIFLEDDIYLKNATLLWYLAHYVLNEQDLTSAYERNVVKKMQLRAASSVYFEPWLTDIEKDTRSFTQIDSIELLRLKKLFPQKLNININVPSHNIFYINDQMYGFLNKDYNINDLKKFYNKVCEICDNNRDNISIDSSSEASDDSSLDAPCDVEIELNESDMQQIFILRDSYDENIDSLPYWLLNAAAKGHIQAKKIAIHQLN